MLTRLLKTSLISNALFLFINSIFNSALGFLFWKVATMRYSPSEIGIATGYLSTVMLISSISSLGLGFTAIKFLPTFQSPKDRVNFINVVFIFSAVASLLFSLIYLLLINDASSELNFIKNSISNIVLFILLTLGWTWYSNLIFDSIFTAYRQSKLVVKKNLIANVTKLVILVLFFHSIGNGIEIILSITLGVFISLATSYYFDLKFVEPTFKHKVNIHYPLTKAMIKFSLFNYVCNWFWQAPTYIFPLLTLNRIGKEASAEFYITWMIVTVIYFVGTSIATSLFVESSYSIESLTKYFWKTLFITLFCQLIIVGGAWISSDILLGFFGKHYILSSSQTLKILLLSSFGYTMISMAQSYLRIIKHDLALIFISSTPIIISTIYLASSSFTTITVAQIWTLSTTFVGLSSILFVIIISKYIKLSR